MQNAHITHERVQPQVEHLKEDIEWNRNLQEAEDLEPEESLLLDVSCRVDEPETFSDAVKMQKNLSSTQE